MTGEGFCAIVCTWWLLVSMRYQKFCLHLNLSSHSNLKRYWAYQVLKLDSWRTRASLGIFLISFWKRMGKLLINETALLLFFYELTGHRK